jgi:hypothetical protein
MLATKSLRVGMAVILLVAGTPAPGEQGRFHTAVPRRFRGDPQEDAAARTIEVTDVKHLHMTGRCVP